MMLKPRATVEDLLGLGIDGWAEIAAMNQEQLDEYLKDVTTLEPKIDPAAQLRGRIIKDKDNENVDTNNSDDLDSSNPIKVKRKPKGAKVKAPTNTSDLKSLFKDLDIEL